MFYLFWIFISLMLITALSFVLCPLLYNPQKRLDKLTLIVLLILLPLSSLLLYFHWGNSDKLNQYYTEKNNTKMIAAEISQFKSPQQLITKLQQVLKQHPDSDRGWFLLGKIYMSTNDFIDAEINYAKANQLKPQQLEYMLAYAEASFFVNKQTLTAAAKNYLSQVLQRQPLNPEAINLLALNAYSAAQYQIAIHYWEQLIPLFPPNTQYGQIIVQAIKQARDRMTNVSPG